MDGVGARDQGAIGPQIGDRDRGRRIGRQRRPRGRIDRHPRQGHRPPRQPVERGVQAGTVHARHIARRREQRLGVGHDIALALEDGVLPEVRQVEGQAAGAVDPGRGQLGIIGLTASVRRDAGKDLKRDRAEFLLGDEVHHPHRRRIAEARRLLLGQHLDPLHRFIGQVLELGEARYAPPVEQHHRLAPARRTGQRLHPLEQFGQAGRAQRRNRLGIQHRDRLDRADDGAGNALAGDGDFRRGCLFAGIGLRHRPCRYRQSQDDRRPSHAAPRPRALPVPHRPATPIADVMAMFSVAIMSQLRLMVRHIDEYRGATLSWFS